MRLRSGAELLRATDQPIKTVASRCGFSSPSHFSSAFSEHFQASPANYRNEG